MKRNDNYDISTAENGYILSHSWREKIEGSTEFDSSYHSKKMLFMDWTSLSTWIADNAIEIPPK